MTSKKQTQNSGIDHFIARYGVPDRLVPLYESIKANNRIRFTWDKAEASLQDIVDTLPVKNSEKKKEKLMAKLTYAAHRVHEFEDIFIEVFKDIAPPESLPDDVGIMCGTYVGQKTYSTLTNSPLYVLYVQLMLIRDMPHHHKFIELFSDKE